MCYQRIQGNGYEILILVGAQKLDPVNDNVDVGVVFDTGERFAATFFTLGNIRELMRRHEATGESCRGLYLWCSDMIIVRELTKETIHKTVDHLILSGEFAGAFSGPVDNGEASE